MPRRLARSRPASKIGRRSAGPTPHCWLPGVEQLVQADARQAGEGDQVDVGIELRLGAGARPGWRPRRASARRRCRRGGPAGRPAARRGSGHGVQRCERGGERGQRVAAAAPSARRAHGGRARSARRAPRSAGALRAARLRPGAAPRWCPGRRATRCAHQRAASPRAAPARAAATSRCSCRRAELDVAARHVAGQQHARGLRSACGGALRAERGLERGAVAAEEVELPAAR